MRIVQQPSELCGRVRLKRTVIIVDACGEDRAERRRDANFRRVAEGLFVNITEEAFALRPREGADRHLPECRHDVVVDVVRVKLDRGLLLPTFTLQPNTSSRDPLASIL